MNSISSHPRTPGSGLAYSDLPRIQDGDTLARLTAEAVGTANATTRAGQIKSLAFCFNNGPELQWTTAHSFVDVCMVFASKPGCGQCNRAIRRMAQIFIDLPDDYCQQIADRYAHSLRTVFASIPDSASCADAIWKLEELRGPDKTDASAQTAETVAATTSSPHVADAESALSVQCENAMKIDDMHRRNDTLEQLALGYIKEPRVDLQSIVGLCKAFASNILNGACKEALKVLARSIVKMRPKDREYLADNHAKSLCKAFALLPGSVRCADAIRAIKEMQYPTCNLSGAMLLITARKMRTLRYEVKNKTDEQKALQFDVVKVARALAQRTLTESECFDLSAVAVELSYFAESDYEDIHDDIEAAACAISDEILEIGRESENNALPIGSRSMFNPTTLSNFLKSLIPVCESKNAKTRDTVQAALRMLFEAVVKLGDSSGGWLVFAETPIESMRPVQRFFGTCAKTYQLESRELRGAARGAMRIAANTLTSLKRRDDTLPFGTNPGIEFSAIDLVVFSLALSDFSESEDEATRDAVETAMRVIVRTFDQAVTKKGMLPIDGKPRTHFAPGMLAKLVKVCAKFASAKSERLRDGIRSMMVVVARTLVNIGQSTDQVLTVGDDRLVSSKIDLDSAILGCHYFAKYEDPDIDALTVFLLDTMMNLVGEEGVLPFGEPDYQFYWSDMHTIGAACEEFARSRNRTIARMARHAMRAIGKTVVALAGGKDGLLQFGVEIMGREVDAYLLSSLVGRCIPFVGSQDKDLDSAMRDALRVLASTLVSIRTKNGGELPHGPGLLEFDQYKLPQLYSVCSKFADNKKMEMGSEESRLGGSKRKPTSLPESRRPQNRRRGDWTDPPASVSSPVPADPTPFSGTTPQTMQELLDVGQQLDAVSHAPAEPIPEGARPTWVESPKATMQQWMAIATGNNLPNI